MSNETVKRPDEDAKLNLEFDPIEYKPDLGIMETTLSEIRGIAREAFKNSFADYYGIDIRPTDKIDGIQSALAIDLYFKESYSDSPLPHALVRIADETANEAGNTLADAFKLLVAKSTAPCKMYRLANNVKNSLQFYAPNKKLEQFTFETSTALNGVYSARPDIMVRLAGLDLDRFLFKVFDNEKDENGNLIYSYRANLVQPIPGKNDYRVHIKRLNKNVIQTMSDMFTAQSGFGTNILIG